MDQYGWPEPGDVQAKIATVPGLTLTEAQIADLVPTIAAVIADFQSPKGKDGSGGTGRTFTPVAEARTFDGNGFGELFVGDIVPQGEILVTWNGSPLPDVLLKESQRGLGYNLLVRSQSSYVYGLGAGGVFPLGKQNITVTALWGFAQQVPDDVAEAVRCEAAAQVIDQAVGGVSGIASQIKTSGTGTEMRFDGTTSAPARWHASYAACVVRYREGNARRLRAMQFRMS